MSKFTDLRDEYFSKIRANGMREFSINSFAFYMKKHGFERVCLYCAGDLPKRRKHYCCDLCSINFYIRYVYTHSWQHVREAYLEKHPNCERCGEKAVEVHHKKPIRKYRCLGMQGDVFDEDNLESCCKKCHLEAAKELAEDLEETKYIKSRRETPLDDFIETK